MAGFIAGYLVGWGLFNLLSFAFARVDAFLAKRTDP